MISESEVLTLLNWTGAIVRGHFLGTSGLHLPVYINKDAIYCELEASRILASALALHFVHDNVGVVIGPAVGGALLARDVARELCRLTTRNVRPVYAEKDRNGQFCIERGYDKIVAGHQVLVVEDVVNTGGSAQKTIEATLSCKGAVVGLGAICSRANAAFNVKFQPLITLALESWEATACPLCQQGIPLNEELGKGAKM